MNFWLKDSFDVCVAKGGRKHAGFVKTVAATSEMNMTSIASISLTIQSILHIVSCPAGVCWTNKDEDKQQMQRWE